MKNIYLTALCVFSLVVSAEQKTGGTLRIKIPEQRPSGRLYRGAPGKIDGKRSFANPALQTVNRNHRHFFSHGDGL